MKPLTILIDTRRPGVCRSCGAALEWALLAESERAMPFNAPIVLLPALHGADVQTARVDSERTVSHFATCPDRAKWRRRRTDRVLADRRRR